MTSRSLIKKEERMPELMLLAKDQTIRQGSLEFSL